MARCYHIGEKWKSNGGAVGSNFELGKRLKADVLILSDRLSQMQNSLEYVRGVLSNPTPDESQLVM
jgi:hypothetical protein